ncbi:phosphoserine phosphatase SerB [bacterium]|nr:phosphoserine phosphatase SerB [bacterium]
MPASNHEDRYALVLAFTQAPEPAIHDALNLCRDEQAVLHGQRWLEEPQAYELDLSVRDAAALRARLAALSEKHACDALLVPQKGRLKKLLVSDMDSTMIMQECIDEMADMLHIKPQISAITERAMRGELNFEAALKERVGLLKGLPLEKLEAVWAERITAMAGASELIDAMNDMKVPSVLVSGGFTFFTERVAKLLGFQAHFSNVLEIENGALTGRVKEPILGADAKLQTMLEWCEKLGIGPEDVMALGDGANDLPMLKAAGMGIAYHAKPHVLAETDYHIIRTTLKTALWAQGIATGERVPA